MAGKSEKRLVTPRKWALAGSVAASALVAAHPALLASLAVAASLPGSVAHASEGGEAGEAGVVLSEGPSAFLTELGLFEAAYRIVTALYAAGKVDQAREHLEGSHHAFYEDLAEQITQHNAPGFKAEVQAFAAAVNDGGALADVQHAQTQLLKAVDIARQAAPASARDRIMSMKDLIAVAAADYEGGVENGQVTVAFEYRDAWGFVEVVRARAEAMAALPEVDLAQAGRDVLAQLDPLAPLFPSLLATSTTGDPALLHVAAGWIEIIALRQN